MSSLRACLGWENQVRPSQKGVVHREVHGVNGSIQNPKTRTIMPKMKTRKAAAKRFKETGTGKFMHNCAYGRHILTKKSAKRKRRLGQATGVKSSEMRRLRASLPYGL